MTYNELNQYILHYITEDKTRSAIMLTAPWGTGKSYYIQHELIPFLANKNHSCILVSLYGIKSLYDISKALYIESRLKFLKKDSEKFVTGKLAAKTVLKGVTSFFGIDLSMNSDIMQELYKSIDLSGKLIILEDLERSDIDILEILGYVNNLVEQDGAKVLLVSNENELIQYEESKDNQDGIPNYKNRMYTEVTQKYLTTKEKTVSDTIQFEPDFLGAIRKIMSDFNKKYFDYFLNDIEVKKIRHFLQNKAISNLRTFIFACQKISDIYNQIKPDTKNELDFIKTIFYSIVAFSQKIKSGEKIVWEGNVFSTELSSEDYPLFRFCYDYVMLQTLDISMVKTAKESLTKLRLYSKNKSANDNDLKILYEWWVYPETNVREAIKSITDKLQDKNHISFSEYGRIALYLVAIKNTIGCNIKKAKELLIKNLHGEWKEINADYIFTTIFDDNEKTEIKEEFNQLKMKMIESLTVGENAIFDYCPSSISKLYDSATRNDGTIFKNNTFAARFDPDKIVKMLKKCTAKNINNFRVVFLRVYQAENIRDFLAGDKEAIKKLLHKIKALEEFNRFDKIQKYQIHLFVINLSSILRKL